MEEKEVKEMISGILEDGVLEKIQTKEMVTNILEDRILKPVLEDKLEENHQHDVTEMSIAQDGLIASSESESLDMSHTNLTKPLAEYKFENIVLVTGDYESYKFQHNNERYLKGCKWSPDGSCLLTSCVDNKLRIYDTPKEFFDAKSWSSDSKLPDLNTSLKVEEGGLVYDFDWFPLMNSWDPISCCFLTTASEEPVHLWDAFTGELRASYRTYNYADEISKAYSAVFNSTGEKIYCGFRDSLRVFDTAMPGMKSTTVKIKAATGQQGIVSCMAFNSTSSLYAVGTYAKEIGLYTENSGTGVCVFKGHGGGITQLIFSPDGNRLYSGSRKDSEIVCWDVRNPGVALFSMLRSVNTQQRIYFDLTSDGSLPKTGMYDFPARNTDGTVSIFNVSDSSYNLDIPHEKELSFNAYKDCCNGVSINPICPVIATTSGQRHVPELMSESDNSEDGDGDHVFVAHPFTSDTEKIHNYKYLKTKVEDCVKLWWVGDTVSTRLDM
ncbi:hypothetical protein LSTR_LSTR002723 [Laodelphax striatellus]|uniref:WD repeat-containing protein 79 n=1 Tax=Laodelphax striatellus TaxID=195883 RepID=A0A482X728_LAOST|nr:hypothetical protein LSTR_LSTR002723 [Laodelphax striatellus]